MILVIIIDLFIFKHSTNLLLGYFLFNFQQNINQLFLRENNIIKIDTEKLHFSVFFLI